ncbi:type II toxin-antitoxin system RelE/ParE family toxin [Sphingomonas sp. AOB5]|uniref:type II toxin-antitoxin system RelE/ParE family toxin n=1 Tax=Sphingomonas sp. AOB5 TaxID=3034017 RepID=UPI0023FA27AB|nr:type II toxin-antitoxin system RelE/ParE family toxin [Sphingomonas sp. AOB5]MDF7775864.1 type II toxin-antitoxin system RelE/ParE family toxin [Sphingomonas sp. AOB5]
MARVIWSPVALHDLDLIHSYIAQFDPVAAARIINALIETGNSLKDFPERGRPATRGRRELPSVPPYLLRYIMIDSTVHVVEVKHSAREPD